jgi:tetratricopeptide (TPR) repeat protein
LEINLNNAGAWYNKGIVLAKLDRTDDAISAYDMALNIDPAFGTAWNNKGNIFARLGKYEKAIEAFKKALNKRADIAMVWNNIGGNNKMGTFVQNVHSFLIRSSMSSICPDATNRVTQELVTPKYRATSAPE